MLSRFGVRVNHPAGLPSKTHFAILIFSSSTVHVPGDERSRQCPGHGYPAHDVTTKTCEYWAIEDMDRLHAALEDIERLRSMGRRVDYQVISTKPVKVTSQVVIEVQTE